MGSIPRIDGFTRTGTITHIGAIPRIGNITRGGGMT